MVKFAGFERMVQTMWECLCDLKQYKMRILEETTKLMKVSQIFKNLKCDKCIVMHLLHFWLLIENLVF